MRQLKIALILGIVLSLTAMFSASAYAKADVIYVVNDMGTVEPGFVNAMNELGLNYSIVLGNQLSTVNWDDYQVILVNNNELSDPRAVPINNKPAIISNRYNMKIWGWAYVVRQQLLSAPYNIVKIDGTSPIMNGITGTNIPVYTTSSRRVFYIPSDYAYLGADLVAATTLDNTDAVIATASAGTTLTRPGEPSTTVNADTVYFGVYDSQYWTPQAKLMFKNSFVWLMDHDHDGFIGSKDCAPNNPAIPGPVEIPYNGIDDDCNPATKDDPAPIFVGDAYTSPVHPSEGADTIVYAKIDERNPKDIKVFYRVNDANYTEGIMSISSEVDQNVKVWSYYLGRFNAGDVVHYYVYASDMADGETSTGTYTFTVTQEALNFNMPLLAGYNLVSIPLDTVTDDKASIFSSVGKIKTLQGNSLAEVTQLVNNKGYFVEASTAHTEAIQGLAITAPQTISFSQGLNLIGISGTKVQKLDTLPAGVIEVAKRNADGSYSIATYYEGHGWQNGFDLEPGKGYWAKAKTAASWTYTP